jgi:hypothetical protein
LPGEQVTTALVAIDDLTSTTGHASCVNCGLALKAKKQYGVALGKRRETTTWVSNPENFRAIM